MRQPPSIMDGTLLSAGTVVDGRYTLLTRLGEGTFGEVWRAADQRLTGRPVALKFLKPEFSDRAEVVARFEAEADALARLAHPNVVAVFDRGHWDRRRYFVMEHVDAGTLRGWIDQHRASNQRPGLIDVRKVFDAVCAGVEAAHAVMTPGPIVHRDLKPDNVLLRAQPGAEVLVKVLDFGVAQLGGRQGTSTGMLLGTPDYMAPEQAMGNVSNVGPWTDVFSLAVLLIEMLTLEARSTPTEVWWGTTLRLSGQVRPLLAVARGDVPPEVWDVVARALHPDGAARFPNAGIFRAALRAAWEAVPHTAVGPTTAMSVVPAANFQRTVAIPEMSAIATANTAYAPAPPSNPYGAPPPGAFPPPWPNTSTVARPTTGNSAFSSFVIGGLALCLVAATAVWLSMRPRPRAETPHEPAPPVAAYDPPPSPIPAAPTPPPARPAADPDEVVALNLSPDAPCLGPANAPVTLEHFSDFQCPFCARVNPTLERVRETYGDRVRICWRDYPLAFHQNAMPAAEAGREVRRQLGDRGFWRFHDGLFAAQRGMNEDSVVRAAVEAGASERAVRRALSSHTHEPAIRAEMDALTAAGVRAGTPTTFVNGRQLRGAQPYERFVAAIDRALAERR
ncbi:MAG: thioredoxin domain-containing protein [Polyangiales bacterium]